ncbi:hypothetical protein KEJ51_06930 [Candidatus Bathyarchaeota archaeon]|nr:hypothetical protein [Candidatus Bathyarchaeota archaeon]
MEGVEVAEWPYRQVNETYAPVLGVNIVGPAGNFPAEGELPVRLDTGYEGFLLISEDLYRRLRLRLSEMPKEMWATGRTVTGETLILRRAHVMIQVPKAKIMLEGYGETFRGNTEDLLGLRFLEAIKISLNGPEKKTYLHQPTL